MWFYLEAQHSNWYERRGKYTWQRGRSDLCVCGYPWWRTSCLIAYGGHSSSRKCTSVVGCINIDHNSKTQVILYLGIISSSGLHPEISFTCLFLFKHSHAHPHSHTKARLFQALFSRLFLKNCRLDIGFTVHLRTIHDWCVFSHTAEPSWPRDERNHKYFGIVECCTETQLYTNGHICSPTGFHPSNSRKHQVKSCVVYGVTKVEWRYIGHEKASCWYIIDFVRWISLYSFITCLHLFLLNLWVVM